MTAKKRGNKLGFWFFRTTLKLFNLSGAYGLLYPVCLYYLLFDRPAVTTAMAYVKRRYSSDNIFQRTITVYKLFISQGKSLIDRFYTIAGLGQFNIELRGYDKIKSLLCNNNTGFILLTAHVGNWQVTMSSLGELGKTVYLLMSPEENAAVKNSLNLYSENEKVKIISPEGAFGGVIEILKAIDEGNIVSVMGDRSYGRDTVEVSLLGGKAYFPHSAFTIAATAGCPIVILLSAKAGKKKYVADISHVIELRISSNAEKKNAIKGYVQEFAEILERFSYEYPLQWFIFHDLWNEKINED